MRIALVDAGTSFNATYRAFLPAVALEARGHEVAVLRGSQSAIGRRLASERFDVGQIYRHHTKEMQRLAQTMRERGIAVVWDNDDELTDVPSDSFLQRNRGGMRAQMAEAGMRRICRAADVVTTTNERLADVYRRYGAERVRVIENHLPSEFTQVTRSRSDGVVIGWVAGGEHEYDLRQLGLRDPLRRVLDAHPEVTFHAIGIDLGLARDRYVHVGRVHYTRLHHALADLDIGLAPLCDIPFNHARSNVKVKEYAAAGVTWLASDITPYSGLGEGQGGLLVRDDGWYEQIERLVLDARLRRRLSKAGRAWAQTQTVDANAHRWETAFEEAIESAARR